jgi:hypothetical protein
MAAPEAPEGTPKASTRFGSDRQPKRHSSVGVGSTSSRLIRRMRNVNGNARTVRRFKEIANALAKDLGGEAALGEAAML